MGRRSAFYVAVCVILTIFTGLRAECAYAADAVGEYESIFDEKQSEADERAEEAYDSISDKTEDIYAEYMERFAQNNSGTNEDHSVGNASRNFGKAVLSGFYSAYSFIRLWAPLIGIFSIAIGVIIALFARKNKGLRKFGISVAIVMPLLLVFIVYGIGYLNSIYL